MGLQRHRVDEKYRKERFNDNTPKTKFFLELKRVWNNFYYKIVRKSYKFIPIIGILILLAIYSGKKPVDIDDVGDVAIKKNMDYYLDQVKDSFDISDRLEVFTTLILLITIWTGYRYWLMRLRFIRRNQPLTKWLLFIISLFIIGKHIKVDSFIGKYFDIGLFIIALFLVLPGTWFIVKWIDSIDLSSDLYCWLLRLVGGVVAFFGALLFMSSQFVMAFSNTALVFNNILWIISLCLIAIGAFCGYRSFRRHPAIHVW